MSDNHAFHFVKLSRSQIRSTIAMAILIPLLADCVQTVWILTYSIPSRYYTAMLYPFDYRGVLIFPDWCFLAVAEALITFLIVCGFSKIAAWLRWPALLGCCALWIYVAFISIAVVS
jgi:hypothetical protein